jgi:gas vesicle protein
MAKAARKVAVGALVAGAAGYLAGILTAPKSGKETRKDIKKAAVKAKTQGEKKLKEIHSDLNKLLDEAKTKGSKLSGKAKEELGQAVETAKAAKDKVREMLSNMHEGVVEDPDIQEVVEKGKQSVDSLKKSIKKS